MKSIIHFFCTNTECEENQKPHEIIGIDPLIDSKWCSKCYKTGKVEIKHGDKEFNSTQALVQYFKGLVEEEKLLNRLIAANAGEENDNARAEEIKVILDDAVCPCCGMSARS